MCHRQETSLMTIPYRVRRGLQRFFIAVGILALLFIVAFGAWMLWLNRYVVYTDDGAKLDFSQVFNPTGGEIATPPASGPDVHISYGNTDELTGLPAGSLRQMEGWVVTAEMLTGKNFAATKAALESLPLGSTVLFDVRNVQGAFYYATSLCDTQPKDVDVLAVTTLIKELQSRECYLIARFPAFRDRWYFLADERGRVPYGLALKGGNGSLWEDTSIKNMGHYWFDPTSTGTLNFLAQVVNEIKNLGFDEVVFSDFRFPNTDKIKFSGDKTEALNEAAKVLVQACSTKNFAVSFVGSHFTAPDGRVRIYLENVAAEDIPTATAALAVENPEAQIVFLADTMDTRYEAYSVLRPLDFYN